MECSYQAQGKEPTIDKPFNHYPFTFLRIENEKCPPYACDIWVSTLPIDSIRCVKIFLPGMEKLFQPGDRLIRIEHVSVTFKLLSWKLEVDGDGLHQLVEESENHIDFCVYR
jgi:hypothetical protein